MTTTPASVTLRPMDSDEFEDFLASSNENYAREIATHESVSEDFARRKAEADHADVLPQGLNTPGQWISVVEADGERVGILWLGARDHGDEKECYIYEITIDERYRGRGFGKAAMELAEAEARSRGLRRIALNVFGGNDVARNLYHSLGYVATSVQMAKELSD